MSNQLLRQGIRLRADARSRQPLLDFYTNATPQGWVRASTQFEVALANGGQLVNVSNLASVTIEAAPYEDKDGPRVFAKTLAGSALDDGLTEPTWSDGSRQNALFILSDGEMNIALGGSDRADFWLVISALTAAGDSIVCGTGRLILADDGTFNAAPPPPGNPGAGITVQQADLRYAPAASAAWTPGVTSVGDGAGGSLEALPTIGLQVPALRTIYRAASDTLEDWLLVAGTASAAADASGNPAVVQPQDFANSTNEKIWVRKR